MKNTYKTIAIIIFFTCISQYIFAQVGINTNEPNRTLDINGNLKINQLKNESTNTNYNRILVTNSLGEVETLKIDDLKSELSKSVSQNKQLFYNATDPDPSKVLECGHFNFSYGPPTTVGKNLDIQASLVNSPAAGLGNRTDVYYTIFRKWGNNQKYYKYYFLPFTDENYAEPKRLSEKLDRNEFAEIYITYPGDESYYRVSFIARRSYLEKIGTDPDGNDINELYNSYTIVCEKF